MSSSRRSSNGRSPLVNQQRQITSFLNKKPTFKPNPSSHPYSSPTPSPSPSTISPSSLQSKRKKPKPPLVIGSDGAASSCPNPSPVVAAKEKSYGDSVVGKKIKVYWPLDKSWYEGRVKMFDEKAGKHLVQYDDAEEEFLALGNEKVEWVEETTKKLKRLRRGSSSPASDAVVQDMEEDLNDGDDNDGS